MTDKLIVRTSDRGMFRQCRQNWDFTSKVRMNYEPNRVPWYFEFGTEIHDGLQVYYDPQMWHLTSHREKVAAAKGSFLTTYKKHRKRMARTYADDQLPPDMAEEYDERVDMGLGMLDHYCAWAKENDYFEPIYAEIEFEVPVIDIRTGEQLEIYGPLESRPGWSQLQPVVYQGRIDLVLRTLDKVPRQMVLDHKTAARFESIDHVDVDTQISSYLWALQEQMGIRMDGFIYSELKKKVPSEPQVLQHRRLGRILSTSKSQATTRPLMEAAIKEHGEKPALYEDYLNWLDTQGADEYFRRHEVHRTQEEIDYVGRMIYMEAREMFEGIDGEGPLIYPNPSKWNCRGCAFKSPCLLRQEGGDVSFMLDSSGLYTKRS